MQRGSCYQAPRLEFSLEGPGHPWAACQPQEPRRPGLEQPPRSRLGWPHHMAFKNATKMHVSEKPGMRSKGVVLTDCKTSLVFFFFLARSLTMHPSSGDRQEEKRQTERKKD